MLDSYSIWNRWKTGSLGLASLAARNSVLRRSVCDLGHAPRSIFCPVQPNVSASLGRSQFKDARLTVLVNRACGHVPHKKFLQTFSSDQTRLAFVTPMASGPIICWETRSERTRMFVQVHTSRSLRCISASRPIFKGYWISRVDNVKFEVRLCSYLSAPCGSNTQQQPPKCEDMLRVMLYV